MIACMLHREDFVKLLIDNGADIFLMDTKGMGVDHYSTLSCNIHLHYHIICTTVLNIEEPINPGLNFNALHYIILLEHSDVA